MAHIDEYEKLMGPARFKFANNPSLSPMNTKDFDPLFLELFLLYSSSMGVGITVKVEEWIKTASQKCGEMGYTDLSHALLGHAAAEAGHYKMRIRDTHAMIARLKEKYNVSFDADALLNEAVFPGTSQYIHVHETTILSDHPYCQLALQYEIELLPLSYGNQLIVFCKSVLGDEILPAMEFLTQHVVLDIGHTKFNQKQLTIFLEEHPDKLGLFVDAGTNVLDAYGQFLNDCFQVTKSKWESLKKG